MKWFKHMSASHSDERLVELIGLAGMEGYGFWWMIMEVVAAQMDDTDKCSASYTLVQWSHLLYSHHNKVSKVLGNLGVTGLVTVEYEGSKIKVTIPNLLKYRDEYSKKSGQSKEKLPSKKKKEKQKENNKKEVSPFEQERLDFFEELWKAYPPGGKIKKKEALTHYLATVKKDSDLDKINLALQNYLDHLKDNEWKRPQNGSTWFNNWQDWEPEESDAA